MDGESDSKFLYFTEGFARFRHFIVNHNSSRQVKQQDDR